MCSIIEIKNCQEYYIHYHSPESLEHQDSNNKMKLVDIDIGEKNNNNSDSFNITVKNRDCNVEKIEKEELWKKGDKDEKEETSDRGSSAGSSALEENETIVGNGEVVIKVNSDTSSPVANNSDNDLDKDKEVAESGTQCQTEDRGTGYNHGVKWSYTGI